MALENIRLTKVTQAKKSKFYTLSLSSPPTVARQPPPYSCTFPISLPWAKVCLLSPMSVETLQAPPLPGNAALRGLQCCAFPSRPAKEPNLKPFQAPLFSKPAFPPFSVAACQFSSFVIV